MKYKNYQLYVEKGSAAKTIIEVRSCSTLSSFLKICVILEWYWNIFAASFIDEKPTHL